MSEPIKALGMFFSQGDKFKKFITGSFLEQLAIQRESSMESKQQNSQKTWVHLQEIQVAENWLTVLTFPSQRIPAERSVLQVLFLCLEGKCRDKKS